MERRETYATTGSRMVVRFFGGWEFEAKDAQNRLPANVGYTKGVPMGGDITDAPSGKAPTFLVAALKDPIGANLDRIQIIKGWLDAKGETHEKVYDVVWSDAATRKPGANGKLPAVGNTVDVANATWTNTIGDSGADHGVEGSRLRSGAVRVLLRARSGDSDSPMDGLRRQVLQAPAAEGSADDPAGARLYVADLVHAGQVMSHILARTAAVVALGAAVPQAIVRGNNRPVQPLNGRAVATDLVKETR